MLDSVRERVARKTQGLSFPGSSSYWERRYKQGGTSGAGSYGALAQFKADHINKFVEEQHIERVIDFGCGDGNQLSLARYPSYLGLDVSGTVIDKISADFAADPTKSFMWYDPARFVNKGAITADLVISLDVILHLVEDEVLESYLRNIARAGTRYAIFFTEDQQESPGDPHVRYRNVAEWSKHLPGWTLLQKIPGPHVHPSAADLFIFERSLIPRQVTPSAG